jgi:hypothetical protein
MALNPRKPTEYEASRAWTDRGETPLLRDHAFNKHSMNDGHHLSPFDNAKIEVGDDGINVALVQGLNPEFERVLSKATRATIGIDPAHHDEDTRDWEEMLQGGLQTALETQVVVFEVSGVSRACTHQLVRSRRAAFHQQSMRASFYGVQPEMLIPESVWRLPDEIKSLWFDAMRAAHKAYAAACEADVSYQDARYVLPEGTTNYIMLEYRAGVHQRVQLTEAARCFVGDSLGDADDAASYSSASTTSGAVHQDQLREDKGQPRRDIQPSEYGGSTCSCSSLHLQGAGEGRGQCPFAWARESNRSFKSKRHSIG